jgi:hypothetical protein
VPDFPTYTPNKSQQIIHEGSSQQSPRESQSPWQVWKYANEVQKQLYTVSDQTNATHRQLLTSIPPYQWNGIDFYPFKIYQYPESFRSTTLDSVNDWRKVRVRSGNVLTTLIQPGGVSEVIGTDGIEFEDYQIYPPESGSGGVGISGSLDILVDANEYEYWFWVESSGSNPTASNFLRHGADPTIVSYANPHPWLNFPSASSDVSGSTFTIIGYSDTESSGSLGRMYIRQYLRTDLMSAGGATPNLLVNICNNGVVEKWKIFGTKVSGSS